MLNRAEFAQLRAHITADALRKVDIRFALFDADGRAADAHAHFAGGAFLTVNMERWIVLDIFQQRAGAAGNHHRGFIGLQLLPDHFLRLL